MVVVASAGLVVGVGCLWGHVRAALIVRRMRAGQLEAPQPRRVGHLSPAWMARWQEARAERHAEAAVPVWLDGCVRAARSGATLRDALHDGTTAVTSPALRSRLAPLVALLDDGAGLADALATLESRPPSLSTARDVLRLVASVGGPAAPALDAVATTVHERAALGRELRALSASARASAVVMAVAPLVFAVLASLIDPRVTSFFASAPGVGCLGAGVALEGAGAWWMHRIVRSVR